MNLQTNSQNELRQTLYSSAEINVLKLFLTFEIENPKNGRINSTEMKRELLLK